MSDKVAIFWDYENCSPPSSSPGLGYDIVNNVRRMAHVFGSVTTFKAYFDISAQSPKSLTLRSELQSSGVSMIDCPHSGRKEVVDKMILGVYTDTFLFATCVEPKFQVDMVAFAVDHPASATIILIAGDRDYAYALSTLRLRNYKVILVVPSPHIPSCLESQASLVIDWSAVVQRTRTETTYSSINPSIRQPYLDLDPNLVAKLSRELGELLDNSDTSTSAYSTTSAASASRPRRISASDLLEPSEFPKSNGTDSFDSTLERKQFHAPLRKSVSTGDEPTLQGLSVPKGPSHSRCASVSAPAPMPARARSATVVERGTPTVDEEPLVCPADKLPAGRRSSPPDIPIMGPTEPSSSSLPTLDAQLELPLHDDGLPSSIFIGSPLEPGQSTNGIPKPEPDPVPQFKHGLNCLAPPFTRTRPLSGGVLVSCANSTQEVVTMAAPTPPVITHDNMVNVHNEHGFAIPETSRREDILGIPNEAELMEALVDPYEVDKPIWNRQSSAVQDTTHVIPNGKVGLRPFDTALSDGVPPITIPPLVPNTPFIGPGDELRSTKSAAPSHTLHDMNDFLDPGAAVSLPSTGPKPSVPLPTTADPGISSSSDDAIRQETRMRFQPLINLLLVAREKGITRPSRSSIAVDLVTLDPHVYERVGISKSKQFKHYSTMAEAAGLIQLGEREGEPWIALHPSWFEEESLRGAQSDPPKTARNIPPTSSAASPMERAANFQSVTRISPSSGSQESDDNASALPPSAQQDVVKTSISVAFQPLIDALVRSDKGHYQMLRSSVGMYLSQEVYTRAGVSNFKDYVSKASEARLVQCGGVSGHAWIRLHPDLRVQG
ncbi:NYN domain-containing protein [Melanogaster broomeanus]|nr:NYN domain-containing protein [Melanogaster broomeanus]